MFSPKAFQKLICKLKVYYFCLVHDSTPKIYQSFLRSLPNFFSGMEILQLKGKKTLLDQIKPLNKPKVNTKSVMAVSRDTVLHQPRYSIGNWQFI